MPRLPLPSDRQAQHRVATLPETGEGVMPIARALSDVGQQTVDYAVELAAKTQDAFRKSEMIDAQGELEIEREKIREETIGLPPDQIQQHYMDRFDGFTEKKLAGVTDTKLRDAMAQDFRAKRNFVAIEGMRVSAKRTSDKLTASIANSVEKRVQEARMATTSDDFDLLKRDIHEGVSLGIGSVYTTEQADEIEKDYIRQAARVRYFGLLEQSPAHAIDAAKDMRHLGFSPEQVDAYENRARGEAENDANEVIAGFLDAGLPDTALEQAEKIAGGSSLREPNKWLRNKKQEIANTIKKIDSASLISKAFRGGEVDRLPRDAASVNEFVKNELELDVPMTTIASWLVNNGYAVPDSIVNALKDNFDPVSMTTESAGAGIMVLNAIGDRDGKRISLELGDGLAPLTMYEATKGVPRQKAESIIATLTSVQARAHLPAIQALLKGDKENDPVVDRSDLLGFSPNVEVISRFDALARLYAVAEINNGVEPEDATVTGAKRAAAQIKSETVVMRVPSEGRGFFGGQLSTEIAIPKTTIGFIDGVEDILGKAMDTHVSNKFGVIKYQTSRGIMGQGSFPVEGSTVIGQYRPDYSVRLPGVDALFIPSLRAGSPIGFLKIDAEGKVSGVDEESDPKTFDALSSIINRTTVPYQRTGDPKMKWHDGLPSKRVMGLPAGATRDGYRSEIFRAASQRFVETHDFRRPDPRNERDKAIFKSYVDAIAIESGFDAFDAEADSAGE